jgi:hypothetical protein
MNLLEIKATVIGPVEAVDGGGSTQVAALQGVCAGCGAKEDGWGPAVDNLVIVEWTPG